MAFATSKILACVCAFCAAEMAGELIKNLSENLPVEGACPRLWCRAGMSKDVAGLGWSLKKQKTRQAVSLAGFFELSWSSRWCRRGDSAPFDIWNFNILKLLQFIFCLRRLVTPFVTP